MRRVPWQVLYLALALIWGSSFLLMMVGLRGFAPVQVSAGRVFTGTLVLLAFAAASRTRLPRDRHTWAHLQVSGFFLATAPFTLFAIAETMVPSAIAGVGNAITPVATVIASWFLLRGQEALPWTKVLGVITGFLGVVVLLEPWGSPSRPDPWGFALCLLAGSSYGIGWAWNRRHLGSRDLGGLAQPTAQLIVASGQMLLVLLAWWAWHRGELTAPWTPVDGHGSLVLPLLSVLALGALGTGLAFGFQFDVVRAVGPTVTTSVTYPVAIVSTLLGVLVLGEHMGLVQWLGAAVILISAFLVQWRRRPAAVSPARQD